ncbi:MAG: hypothetical protein AAF633_03790 [Chloroflexota bacterium]
MERTSTQPYHKRHPSPRQKILFASLWPLSGTLLLLCLMGCQTPEPPILIDNHTPERPALPEETMTPSTLESDQASPTQTMPSIRTTLLPASDLEEVSSPTNLFKRYESQRGYAFVHPRDWFVADIQGETFVSQKALQDTAELSRLGGHFVKITSRLRPHQLDHTTLHLDVLKQWEDQAAVNIVSHSPPTQQTKGGLESIRSQLALEIEDQAFELVVVTYQTNKNVVTLAGMLPSGSSSDERNLFEAVVGSLEIDASRLVPIETFKREPVAEAVALGEAPVEAVDLSDVEGVLSPLGTASGAVAEFGISAWRVIGRAGEVYLVDVTATTDRFDPTYDLLDPNGRSILPRPLIPGQLSNQANEETRLLIPADGNYTLVIQGANYAGGLYDVTLRKEQETPFQAVQPTGLLYSQAITGTLAANQSQSWITAAHPNRPLNIDIDTADLETWSLDIQDLSGNSLQTTTVEAPQVRFFTVRRSQFIKIILFNQREPGSLDEAIPFKLKLSPAFENQNITLVEFQSDEVVNLPIHVSAQADSRLVIGINSQPNPLDVTIRSEREADPLFQSSASPFWTEQDYRFAAPGRYRLRVAPTVNDVALATLSTKEIGGYVVGEAGLQFSPQENQRVKLGFFGNDNRVIELSAPYLNFDAGQTPLEKTIRFVAQPQNREMDITLALISESGQVILNKDEGFGGAAEEIVLDGNTGAAFSGRIAVRALPGHFGFVDILVDVQSP